MGIYIPEIELLIFCWLGKQNLAADMIAIDSEEEAIQDDSFSDEL